MPRATPVRRTPGKAATPQLTGLRPLHSLVRPSRRFFNPSAFLLAWAPEGRHGAEAKVPRWCIFPPKAWITLPNGVQLGRKNVDGLLKAARIASGVQSR